VGFYREYGDHRPEPEDWNKRERRRIAADKRHETAARERAKREGQFRLDDHNARFATTVDGHGRQAKCHVDACPDDEVRDTSPWDNVSSNRVIGDLAVEEGISEPDDE